MQKNDVTAATVGFVSFPLKGIGFSPEKDTGVRFSFLFFFSPRKGRYAAAVLLWAKENQLDRVWQVSKTVSRSSRRSSREVKVGRVSVLL